MKLKGLTVAHSIPHDVAAVDIGVRWLKSEVVALSFQFRDKQSAPLRRYTARCGAHIWREALMPALRMFYARVGIACTITETAPVGPIDSPYTPTNHD